MLTNKQIVDAQRVLKRFESTPVKFIREDGVSCWRVTYDDDTYNLMLGVISAVAEMPIRELETPTEIASSVVAYHREKI